MEALYLINWWAWACAGVFSIVLEFVWFRPKIFGNSWANAFGLQDGDIDIRLRGRKLLVGIIYNLLALYGLAVLLHRLAITAPLGGLELGLFCAFFFSIAPLGNIAAFEQWRAPRVLIHGSFRLVLFGGAGAFLGWWH